MICSLSTLEDSKLERIASLEKELGDTLLAFSCYNYQANDISSEELDKIQALEEELGLSLVAVKA